MKHIYPPYWQIPSATLDPRNVGPSQSPSDACPSHGGDPYTLQLASVSAMFSSQTCCSSPCFAGNNRTCVQRLDNSVHFLSSIYMFLFSSFLYVSIITIRIVLKTLNVSLFFRILLVNMYSLSSLSHSFLSLTLITPMLRLGSEQCYTDTHLRFSQSAPAWQLCLQMLSR